MPTPSEHTRLSLEARLAERARTAWPQRHAGSDRDEDCLLPIGSPADAAMNMSDQQRGQADVTILSGGIQVAGINHSLPQQLEFPRNSCTGVSRVAF
jgi:hypothetical protein